MILFVLVATVLGMRAGSAQYPQPAVDADGNVLLWNGEAYAWRNAAWHVLEQIHSTHGRARNSASASDAEGVGGVSDEAFPHPFTRPATIVQQHLSPEKQHKDSFFCDQNKFDAWKGGRNNCGHNWIRRHRGLEPKVAASRAIA